jgi:hypothetical protein
MGLLEYTFYLGIVYIVFSLIWGFFMLILNMLTMGQRKGVFEDILLRAGQYYFIVALTALVAIDPPKATSIEPRTLTITGLIVLFLYLLGKMERSRIQMAIKGNMFGNMNVLQRQPNRKIELVFLIAGLAFYTVCTFEPMAATNDATLWFQQSIWDIYETPVIGWIIGLIGVFFLLGMFLRAIMVIQLFINRLNGNTPSRPEERNENQYDDFEVMDDEGSGERENNP